MNYLEQAGTPVILMMVLIQNDTMIWLQANEIKTLTNDELLIAEVEKHLQMLDALEKELSTGA